VSSALPLLDPCVMASMMPPDTFDPTLKPTKPANIRKARAM
jgi:hypothetical protein